MPLKENLNQSSETYKVIFADSCADTEKGSVFERIQKGEPFKRAGLTEKEDGILKKASKGGRGLGKKRIGAFLKEVKTCTTYDKLAALDPKIQDIKNSHDIWKHCKSPYLGKKENSCWEFNIGGYCRMMCYIDHKTKQILVMDSAFTASEHAVAKMYQNLSDLGDEIFERTNGTNIFEQIKQDADIVRHAQEAHKVIEQEKPEDYQFGIQSIDDYAKALKALHQTEKSLGSSNDSARKTIEKEFFENMELLHQTNKDAFSQLLKDVAEERKNHAENPEWSDDVLARLPVCVLGQVYAVMQRIAIGNGGRPSGQNG